MTDRATAGDPSLFLRRLDSQNAPVAVGDADRQPVAELQVGSIGGGEGALEAAPAACSCR